MSGRFAGLLAGLLFLAIGSGQIFLSLRLPGGLGISAAEPGPGLFPLMVGALMCVAAAAQIVQAWRDQRREQSGPRRAPVDIMLLAATIAGYILLLPRAGFAISAFLLLMGTLSIYGMPGLWRRAATAAAATAVSYLVFTLALRVNMPAPSWLH
jgi:cell division protein FtsW (lipid II flippase)